jgi:hypothetical protein
MSSTFPSFAQFPPARPVRAHDAQAPTAPRRSLLGRLVDALIEARRREAEQQVARLLARSGGRFTDDLEREALGR